jgi:two-component system sensor histidine kinase RegB
LAALLVVHYGVGFHLPLPAALSVVGASVILNILLSLRRPVREGLGEPEAMLYLGFDILQLSALLFLTGGLTNPFALLIAAPVTISAATLSRRGTTGLSVLAVVSASVLAVWHRPLPAPFSGLGLPSISIIGAWSAVVVGTIFLAAYVGSVAAERRRINTALGASQLALAREQRLSSLGALAAAAAHELGSPLSTIAVTVGELVYQIPSDSPWAGDIAILKVEVERCREILAELGRRPEDTDEDSPFSRRPLSVFIEAAIAPYDQGGVVLEVRKQAIDDSEEPVLRRRPEIVHGLGSLVQNAVQFADRQVVIQASWDADRVTIVISDDGPGFPPAVLDRIGEPYVSSRPRIDGHMGLGIFIAQTLLEQSGARLTFVNARRGARVDIVWQRHSIENGTM